MSYINAHFKSLVQFLNNLLNAIYYIIKTLYYYNRKIIMLIETVAGGSSQPTVRRPEFPSSTTDLISPVQPRLKNQKWEAKICFVYPIGQECPSFDQYGTDFDVTRFCPPAFMKKIYVPRTHTIILTFYCLPGPSGVLLSHNWSLTCGNFKGDNVTLKMNST